MTPLHYAAREGNKLIVNILLANIGFQQARDLALQANKRGNTPLHLAALNGSIGVIASLVKVVNDYNSEDIKALIHDTFNAKGQSVWSCSSSAARRILENPTSSKSCIWITFPKKSS